MQQPLQLYVLIIDQGDSNEADDELLSNIKDLLLATILEEENF
jgi:hypothetical protein